MTRGNKIQHFVSFKRSDGTARYYWQPSATLRAAGEQAKRLSDIKAEAARQAQAENDRVDAKRKAGELTAPAPKSRKPLTLKGSVGEMVANYRASDEFKSKPLSTRRSYEDGMVELEDWARDEPKRAITPKLALGFHKMLASYTIEEDGEIITVTRPAYAASVCRVARLIFNFDRRDADDIKSADDVFANPFRKMKLPGRKRHPDPRSLLWSQECVDAYAAAARRVRDRDGAPRPLWSVATAIQVNYWIGQRKGDVIKIPVNVMNKDSLVIRQSKTGALVDLPIKIVPYLVAAIGAELARWHGRFDEETVQPTALLVSEATNREYNEDHFSNQFELVRDEVRKGNAALGIAPDPVFGAKTFMHLRHTAVVLMAEADVDILAISSVTGHEPKTVTEIIKHYAVRTRKQSGLAFGKRLAVEAAELEEAKTS